MLAAPRSCSGVRFQETRTTQRDDRQRHQIRGAHGEDHADRQWCEEILGDSTEQYDREENHHDGDRGDEHGSGDLAGAIERSTDGCLSHAQVSGDIFQRYDGLVDDQPDSQRQPTQRHAIDGIPTQIEADESRKS